MPSTNLPSPVPGASVQTDCPDCHRFHDGACPPPPETVTLPFTGKVVPAAAARLVVKPKGQLATRNGVAFSAEVYDGKRLIGLIEDSGNGGGTWFHHHTRADAEMWEALVDEYAAIDEEHRFVAHESFANDLFEEAMLPKEMNRRRTATFRRVGDDDEFYTVRGVKPGEVHPAQWAKITKDFGPVEQWVKGTGWVVVEVSA